MLAGTTKFEGPSVSTTVKVLTASLAAPPANIFEMSVKAGKEGMAFAPTVTVQVVVQVFPSKSVQVSPTVCEAAEEGHGLLLRPPE